jgi:hypothetical protein
VPDHAALARTLESNKGNEVLIVLFIPSRDKNSKLLPDHDVWWKTAAQVLSEEFGGATVMPAAKGFWKNYEDGKLVEEDVTLAHCYVDPKDLDDIKKVKKLAKFLHGMGKVTNQGEIALVIDGVFHRIRKFSLA